MCVVLVYFYTNLFMNSRFGMMPIYFFIYKSCEGKAKVVQYSIKSTDLVYTWLLVLTV